jgi:hypothetical protein
MGVLMPRQMAKMPFAEHDNGPDIPGGSNRSPFHNTRSATAIARRLADPECPSPESGG